MQTEIEYMSKRCRFYHQDVSRSSASMT